MDATQDIPSPGHPWLCCRACLSTDCRLFNIHEYKLADAFADITGTPVAKDKLPQFLCSYCRTQLLKSASFRDMCLCTQKSLRSTLLKEKPDLDCTNEINRPSKNLLLTINQVYTININPQTHNQQIHNLNIAGIIKKTGAKTEFENQNFFLNIPADKLKYIKNRVRNIENTVKEKGEVVKKEEDNVASMAEVYVNVEIEDTNYELNEAVKKELDFDIFDTEVKDEPDDVNAVKIPAKRRKELNKNVEAKKMRINMKTVRKQKCNGIKREAGKTKREKRKIREPENDFMPQFDFAKFENANDVKIITLTKEEQVEEIASRKKSQNYLDSQFKCEDCAKGFNAEAAWNKHLLRHNPVQGAFACEICTVRYRRSLQVQVHQDVHRLKFVCNACNFVSRTRCQAISHHDTHAVKNYRCQHCEKAYDKMSTYFSHVRVVHPALCVACDDCGETFVSESGLRYHMKRTHGVCDSFPAAEAAARKYAARRAPAPPRLQAPTPAELPATPTEPFVCEHCGRVMKTSALLSSHQQHHHRVKPFVCSHCPMTFAAKTTLEAHIRTHTGEKPFQCPECPLAFCMKYNLKRHHRTAHEGIRDNVPCTICGRKLSTKSALKLHARAVHRAACPRPAAATGRKNTAATSCT